MNKTAIRSCFYSEVAAHLIELEKGKSAIGVGDKVNPLTVIGIERDMPGSRCCRWSRF